MRRRGPIRALGRRTGDGVPCGPGRPAPRRLSIGQPAALPITNPGNLPDAPIAERPTGRLIPLAMSPSPRLQPATYSIVVPAYNEGSRIGGSLQRILDYWRSAAGTRKLSSSTTAPRTARQPSCATMAAGTRGCGCWRIPATAAKATACAMACCTPAGNFCCSATPISPRPSKKRTKLFAAIAQGADVAIGSRWVNTKLQARKQPLHRQFFGRMFNLALRLVLGLQFKDTQCGFKAFHAARGANDFSAAKRRALGIRS